LKLCSKEKIKDGEWASVGMYLLLFSPALFFICIQISNSNFEQYLIGYFVCYEITKKMRIRWTWHVARKGEERNAHSVLVGNPEGNRPLGRLDIYG
jgi:hypothetical protein